MKKPSSKTSIFKKSKNIKCDSKGCIIYSDIEMKTFNKGGKLLKTKIIKSKKNKLVI